MHVCVCVYCLLGVLGRNSWWTHCLTEVNQAQVIVLIFPLSLVRPPLKGVCTQGWLGYFGLLWRAEQTHRTKLSKAEPKIKENNNNRGGIERERGSKMALVVASAAGWVPVSQHGHKMRRTHTHTHLSRRRLYGFPIATLSCAPVHLLRLSDAWHYRDNGAHQIISC